MSWFLKKHSWLSWLTLVVLATGLSIAIAWARKNGTGAATETVPPPAAAVETPSQRHAVVIKPGPRVPRLDTGLKPPPATR